MRLKAENKKGKLVLYTLYKVLLIVTHLLSFIFPMNDSCLGGFVSLFFSQETSLRAISLPIDWKPRLSVFSFVCWLLPSGLKPHLATWLTFTLLNRPDF